MHPTFKYSVSILCTCLLIGCGSSNKFTNTDLSSVVLDVENMDSFYEMTISNLSHSEHLYKASLNRLDQFYPDDVIEIYETDDRSILTAKINNHPLSLNRVLWSLGSEHYRNHSAEYKPDVQEGEWVIISNMPELIGGIDELQKKVKYPEELKGSGVNGEVLIKFIVNEFGEVEDPHVTKGIHQLADEEAVRVITESKFKPGMQFEGVPVRVQIELPVLFIE